MSCFRIRVERGGWEVSMKESATIPSNRAVFLHLGFSNTITCRENVINLLASLFALDCVALIIKITLIKRSKPLFNKGVWILDMYDILSIVGLDETGWSWFGFVLDEKFESVRLARHKKRQSHRSQDCEILIPSMEFGIHFITRAACSLEGCQT